MNIDELAKRPVGRLLWDYSMPAVVGMVVTSLYNVIDRIFIGQVEGAAAISGLAITFPVMNLATALGVLVGAGASTRVSILLGQGNRDEANRVLGNALTLTFIIGAVYISLFAMFLDDILRAFGASDVTLPYAHDFIHTLLPALLLMNLTYGFNNIQRASGYPRRAMTAMLLSAGVNLVFGWLFICELRLGVRGAALATTIAMFSAMVFVMWHFFKKTSTVHFSRGIFRLRRRIVTGIVAIGAAPSLVNVAGCMINIIINKTLVSYGGDNAVGAAGIFTTYTQLICMVVLGICMGMQPIVGYNYGARQLGRMRRTYFLAVGAATALCVAGAAGGLGIPGLIARAFTTDATLTEVTVNCLRLALWAFPVVGFQIVSTTFFQSLDCPKEAIVLSLSRQVIFLIPLLLILPRTMGIDGVWLSFPISDIFATAVTGALIIFKLRQLKRQAASPM